MRFATPFLALSFAAMSLSTSFAADEERYTIVPFEDGIIRVDRSTGAIDKCRDVSGRLACELAADERMAWQRETDALSDTVSDLEKRMARLERDGVKAAPDGSPIDSVEEMEKAWTMAETFFRRFFDLVETLKSDREKPEAL